MWTCGHTRLVCPVLDELWGEAMKGCSTTTDCVSLEKPAGIRSGKDYASHG